MKKTKLAGLLAASLLTIAPLAATTISSSVEAASIAVNNTNYSFLYVPVNGNVDVTAIKNTFGEPGTTVSVDISKVETRVASTYPVEVTKTNLSTGYPDTFTLNVIVGDQHDLQELQGAADSDAEVYKIDGNTVSETGIYVKDGAKVSTYGTTTINGVSYTRLNGANSNLYLKTNWFDGSYTKGTDSDLITKYIMHKAAIYDKNGKKTGKSYREFRNIDVYPDTVKINGTEYYRVYNTSKYVKTANIDGTKRTLKSNAYVYKNSRTRANKKVLKKGTKVTTYGAPYKFANGKYYYRIGKDKQYVRTANF